MKTHKFLLIIITMAFITSGCNMPGKEGKNDDFVYQIDQFADIKIMRYQVPGFEELSVQQKKLIYYLSEAALSGRDIIWDQNYEYNLFIRRTLEKIVANYEGDRESENFKNFMVYLKRRSPPLKTLSPPASRTARDTR